MSAKPTQFHMPLPDSAISPSPADGFELDLKDMPRLVLPGQKSRRSGNNNRSHIFRYRSKHHKKFPHVVKFSGGCSSGLMLFLLLESGILKAERGDVIVFNNTGAEHPSTYQFASQCKKLAESQYDIPFFWVEHQTYEDVRKGEWTRLPSYRLINTKPWSQDNPEGYRYKGEPFEELLSWSGYVPNQFRRTCTRALKLECTRMFLRNWFAGKEEIPRQGHSYEESQIDDDLLYRRHKRNGGGTPRKIFFDKKNFVLSRSTYRPRQRYCDFSRKRLLLDNPIVTGNSYGGQAEFGKGKVEYIAFIGLRGDEPFRVERVARRAENGKESQGYEGEHVYMPLDKMKITTEDVKAFWKKHRTILGLQSDRANLIDHNYLSNCVYCFLKGSANLSQIHEKLQNLSVDLYDTPSDIRWWERLEQRYGRDLIREDRISKSTPPGVEFIGFFGSKRLRYQEIATKGACAFTGDNQMLPCDCTD